MDSLTVWRDCVQAAKNKLGKGNSYGFISKEVLNEARKGYCAIVSSGANGRMSSVPRRNR
jgi:hypothetical protein